MADIEIVHASIESISVMIAQLGKAFDDLEALQETSCERKTRWKEIVEHFINLQRAFKKRCDELAEKEKSLEGKDSKIQALLVQREKEVAAKEQALVDRLQELRDAAVTAILEAHEKYKRQLPEPAIIINNIAAKVSSFSNSDPIAPVSASEEKFPDKSGLASTMAVEVQPRPELVHFCKQMDIKGLLKFVSDNQRDLGAIHREMPIALKSAPEPGRFVLEALEAFHAAYQTTHQENNKDAALQGLRGSCVMLMESMASLLVGSKSEPYASQHLSSEAKQQAKAIGDEWKKKLEGMDAATAADEYSLEVLAFLQLLAAFNIASEFDEDELCKLVLAVAHHRQTPELCHFLGLIHKMPGLIEELVNNGKQVDAIQFVHAFQLSETFPPVYLLKMYLKNLRRGVPEKGGKSAATLEQELEALKAVIRCIEEYKLESYPTEQLIKRVAQLERVNLDNKREGNVGRPQCKRPRPNGGYISPIPFVEADRQPQVYGNMGGNQGDPGMNSYTPASTTYDYQALGSGVYSHQQLNAVWPYYNPHESGRAASHSGASSNHGGFAGSGFQSFHQRYM